MAASNRNLEELLNAYVDRELTSGEEEQLFAELAQDDELRAELKQLQALRAETRNYLSALTPSAAVTAGVFAGLGMTGSAAASAAATAAQSAGTASQVATAGQAAATAAQATGAATAVATGAKTATLIATAQNLWLPISAAVVSASVTTVAMVTILTTSPVQQKERIDQPTPQVQEQTVTAPAPVIPPAVTEETDEAETSQATSALSASSSFATDGGSEEESSNTSETAVVEKSIASTAKTPVQKQPATTRKVLSTTSAAATTAQSSVAAKAESSEETTATEDLAVNTRTTEPASVQTPPTATETVPAERKPVVPALMESPVQPPAKAAPMFVVPVAGLVRIPMREHLYPLTMLPDDEQLYLTLDEPTRRPKFAAILRGFSMSSYPYNNVDSRSSFAKNISAGLYYKFGDSHSLGIEAGYENFNQNYEGEIDGTNRLINQNYLTSWVAANYRYQFGSILGIDGLRPFLSLGAGMTSDFWPMTRGSAGLSYMPMSWLEIQAATEGTVLMYPFQSRWFSTEKGGVTYGFLVHF